MRSFIALRKGTNRIVNNLCRGCGHTDCKCKLKKKSRRYRVSSREWRAYTKSDLYKILEFKAMNGELHPNPSSLNLIKKANNIKG